MGRVRWRVSPGAALLFGLLYFFDDAGLISALFPAVLAHELGHVAALRLCRARLRRVSVGAFGIEMDYTGALSGGGALCSLAAGPAAGFLYAVAACAAGGTFWRLSGALSFCLSVFNLLPALPLDGGRLAAELAGESAAVSLSRVSAAGLALAGAVLFGLYRFPAPLAAGVWLCCYNFSGPSRGFARKRRKSI